MHFGHYPEERIDVIYQSASQRFQTHLSDNQLQTIRNKFQLPQQFILNVGTIEKRKNILLAVKALPLLSNDTHLVIVGRNTPYTKEIEAWAKNHNISDRVHILNNVNNDDLAGIYQLATCFVYPSRYEGFWPSHHRSHSMWIEYCGLHGLMFRRSGRRLVPICSPRRC